MWVFSSFFFFSSLVFDNVLTINLANGVLASEAKRFLASRYCFAHFLSPHPHHHQRLESTLGLCITIKSWIFSKSRTYYSPSFRQLCCPGSEWIYCGPILVKSQGGGGACVY
ncbi:hypothetical protein LX32DRAFT_285907 [Colletotrichum zoysiae]|uniref:Secreted protein n=1 Tax=Colletotrichum zoysiae TaxID=1216348 RepID=A0AAD9H1W7_9PEZI|nr:hypothetical protein LX32DRAFT_285907 [Colletotrichum zoysiae]